MKYILVTGWMWYIGSHGVVSLIENGYTPIVIDNLSNSQKEVKDKMQQITLKSVIFHEMDLRDKEKLTHIFWMYQFDAVIHFAWAKAVWESTQKPFYYYENNVVWSLNLFECMEKFACKKIIFSSSATVYDNQKQPPFVETDMVWNTTNPYGTTKFIIENILRDLAFHKGFQVINLRYFNPIGAHKSGKIWEKPNGIPNNLLPFIMKVVVGELSAIQVFWNDYDTKDGTGERDYIHVLDLIDGHMKALDFLFTQEKNHQGYIEIFNLWTGNATSVLDMIEMTSQIVWREIPYVVCPRRGGDLAQSFCNPEKAEKMLWWKAKYSVKEAIQDSYNFMIQP